jgi:hypothetical protein
MVFKPFVGRTELTHRNEFQGNDKSRGIVIENGCVDFCPANFIAVYKIPNDSFKTENVNE